MDDDALLGAMLDFEVRQTASSSFWEGINQISGEVCLSLSQDDVGTTTAVPPPAAAPTAHYPQGVGENLRCAPPCSPPSPPDISLGGLATCSHSLAMAQTCVCCDAGQRVSLHHAPPASPLPPGPALSSPAGIRLPASPAGAATSAVSSGAVAASAPPGGQPLQQQHQQVVEHYRLVLMLLLRSDPSKQAAMTEVLGRYQAGMASAVRGRQPAAGQRRAASQQRGEGVKAYLGERPTSHSPFRAFSCAPPPPPPRPAENGGGASAGDGTGQGRCQAAVRGGGV
jgi:hypothetical protein